MVCWPILNVWIQEEVIMRDTQDAPVLVIQDIGPATELTKGIAFITPFIEAAPPPFAYYCPNCGG